MDNQSGFAEPIKEGLPDPELETVVEESQLVAHARRELALLETDPWMIEGVVKVIKTFAEMGQSGGSAEWAIWAINELLRFNNLTPLTNDPAEWMDVGPNVWQSKRNSEAFSNDGGVTHYLLSEAKMIASNPSPNR